MTEIESICDKLKVTAETRGGLARVARESGVSSRTLYHLLRAERKPNPMTVEKLAKHFKKADKKASRL